MSEMKISNTLVNDTNTGEIAYARQLKDNAVNYAQYAKITAAIKERFHLDDKFQDKLNNFFLYHYDEFHRFLEDDGVDPTIIDSWKEVQDFLEGLPDNETMWLKNQLTRLDNRITAMDIPDGGAYDVSADHVDGGGTYATYQNLSSALSAIATADRKSGMSIRFINSNTGKYEQWRYLNQYINTTAGDNAFINTANWTRGSSDGIYDVSVENAVNGIPTPYETLSSALAAIPAHQKVPGMSIKFIQNTPAKYTVVKTEGVVEQPTGTEIQSDPGIISGTYTAGELSIFSTLPATLNSSLTYYLTVTETVDEQEVTTYTTWVITYVQSSDKKYVQYRLMLSTFTAGQFINIANWQGVDIVPVIGSQNLAESGGVIKIASSISQYIPLTWASGGINADGTIAPNNTRLHSNEIVNLEPGKYNFYFINDDYELAVSCLNDAGSYASQGWLSNNVANVPFGSSVYFVLKRKNNANIDTKEGDNLLFKKEPFSVIAWKQGSVNTDGDNIGKVNTSSIRAFTKLSLPAGSILYITVNSGYKMLVHEWDGESSSFNIIGTFTSRNFNKYTTTYNNVYILAGKTNDGNMSYADAESNVPIIINQELQPLFVYQTKRDDNMIADVNFAKGIVYTSGDNIGTINKARSNRATAIIDFIPIGSKIAFALPDGYFCFLVEWNGVTSEMSTTTNNLKGHGFFTTSKEKAYIVIGKNDDSNIDIDFINQNKRIFVSFDSQPIEELALNFANTKFYFQGGTPYDDPSQGLQPNSARQTAIIDNAEGKVISYNVKSGYRIALSSWDGISHAASGKSGWKTGFGTYKSRGKYLYVICAKVANTNITSTEAQDNIELTISNDYNSLALTVNDLLSDKDSYNVPYFGEALPFGRNMAIKDYMTVSNWENSQGGAIYGDYLVTLMATDEIEVGQTNGHLYNISTGALISNLVFGKTLNGVDYYRPHANEVCFGTEFYNENSIFPLLYVSQVNGGGGINDIRGERGVLVYDIQFDSDNNTYTPVLVQAIIPDLNDAELMAVFGNYTPNYIVDTDKNELYVLNYPNASWFNLDGDTYVCRFKLPKISDGQQIVLTYADLIEHYTIPLCFGLQMTFYFAGKLYISGGFAGINTTKVIRVWDLIKKVETTRINLKGVLSEEPQFIGLYNNRFLWYGAGTSGLIREFLF